MDSIASLANLVDPTITEILDETKDQLSADLQYKTFGFEDYTPNVKSPKFSSTSGLSIAQYTVEGRPYSREDRLEGYSVEATVKKFTKAVSWTEELVEWINRGEKERAMEFKEDAQAAQNSLYERIDTDAAKPIYLAHGTTFQTGGDGVALAAYNHPSKESGISTQRNIFKTTETHLPPSYSSIIKARNAMIRFYDLKGVQIKRPLSFELWHAQELTDTVERALNADKLPGTNLNDPNTLRGKVVPKVIQYQPVGYSTYWCLVAKERVPKAVKMLWGWQPRFNSESNYMNGTFFREGSVYFAPVFRSWQFGFFSKGDGSVISN